MKRRTAMLAAALLVAGSGVARADTLTLRLPAPTGPHRVGVTTLHLVDDSRPEPWPAATNAHREMMVTLFYPARDVRGYPLAPQLSPRAAAMFGRIDVHIHPELPKQGVDWAATMTRSHVGAPALPGRRPVVLYSPGAGDPRTLGTTLAQELASRGHVVVTMDHPGETSVVEFPDGRVRTVLELPGDPRVNPEVFRTMISTRLADTAFLLSRLEVLAGGGNPDAHGRALPEDLGRSLDLRRLAMYGHSAGGTTAAQALQDNPAIDVAVNLEGYLDHASGELFPVAGEGVDRPLLLLGTDGFHDERYERSWTAMLAHGGCTERRRIDNASHHVFTDLASMAPQMQAAGLMSAADRVGLVGAIEPEAAVRAVRGHVLSFIDRR